MPSLLELVEKINKGELIDAGLLEVYQESSNAAEKFLANHARAMLDLRRSHAFLLEALEAIDYADQKVLFQFLSVLGFLGLHEQRTQPVIRFGAAALNRRETALALEAIQSGVIQDLQQANGSYIRDRENALFIAQQYERAAHTIAWSAPGKCDWTNPQLRIGYVTSSLADDDAAARLVSGLAKSFDGKDVKLHVYCTEANVRREKLHFNQGPFTPASAKRGKETIELLARRKTPLWMAPVDQDLAACAKELANQIFKDQIDVLVVDASQGDPIAAVVANWNVAKAKLNLVRRSPLLTHAIDGVIYVEPSTLKADEPYFKSRHIPTHLLTECVEPAGETPGNVNRTMFGIPEQSVILATVVNEADEPISPEFLDAMVHCLRQHPHAVLLTAGEGDVAPMKRRLESAGLSKRAGFVGKRKDLVDFLRMADVFVAPFPKSTSAGVLSAMAAGRAVVAMAGDKSDPHSAQAFVGDENATSDPVAYVERVGKLARDANLRAQIGEALKQRVAGQFTVEQTARTIEALCRSLVEPTQAKRENEPRAQAA